MVKPNVGEMLVQPQKIYNLVKTRSQNQILILYKYDALLDFTWSVTRDLCGSDHYPIFLSSPDVLLLPRVPGWRLGHADWGLFKQLAIVDYEVDEFLDLDSFIARYCNVSVFC